MLKGDLRRGVGGRRWGGCGPAVPIKGFGFYSPFIRHPLECLKQGVI